MPFVLNTRVPFHRRVLLPPRQDPMPNAQALIANALTHSRHLERQLASRSWLAARLESSLGQALTRQDMEHFLAETPLDDNTLAPRLRALKTWVAAHAMVRDLAGLAPLAEVTTAMTLIAEVALCSAQQVLGR